MLGPRALHLSVGFISFFMRKKNRIDKKDESAELMSETTQEMSLRYTNRLNRSTYNSLKESKSIRVSENS